MIETPDRSWVWRSTEDSRAAGLVSILAVAETLVCVALYWALWLWIGVTWHHWLILIATPLVLLRSKQSVDKGVEWFNAFLEPRPQEKLVSPKKVIAVGLSAALAGGVAWSLATSWLGEENGWVLFGKAALIGWLFVNIVFAGALAGARVGEEQVGPGGIALALAVGPGIVVGFWFRATVTRFAATARYLWLGALQLPVNWRFSMLVSDVWHAPELIPGNEYYAYGGAVSLSWCDSNGSRKKFDLWLIHLLGSIIFFVPAMIWRWAIKSTAWFYIPLLWVRRGWLSHEGEDMRIWAKSYSRMAINWLWLIFGGISFVALAVGLFSVERWQALKQVTSDAEAPMTVLGFLLSLNWVELMTQPWMLFYIPSYVLTILIFFALDSIAAEIRAGATPESREAVIAHLKWAANARAVLTNIGLALALWYFLGAVDAWGQVQAFFAQRF